MPYISDAQRAYFNANKGKTIPAAVVNKFNKESKGMSLPDQKRKQAIERRILNEYTN